MMVELTKVPAKQAREQRAMVRLIPEQRKDKVRGEGAIVSFQHRPFADLKMPQYQEHNQKQLVWGLFAKPAVLRP